MNLADCISIIKNCTTLACEYHVKNKCEYSYDVRENRFNCAKEQAIKALEKQIPKKIAYQIGRNGLKHEKCPTCGSFHVFGKHCTECGQAVDYD